jgi:hypothetical protein
LALFFGGLGAGLPYTPLQNYVFFVIRASFLRFFFCKSAFFLLSGHEMGKNEGIFDYE